MQHNFRQFPRPFKTPLSEETTGRLWDVIYQALLTAFLMGMNHAGERVELSDELFKIMPEAIPFEEAAGFLAARVPLSKEEFDALEKQLRFRAFTVARLTELDAINRVKEKLVKVIEEGKTFQQFMAEAGEDELLKRAGFHRSNPWYWETVFRTNLQTAYNAGRRLQLMKDPDVLYYEFVGIRDRRQTEICRRRSGVVRPAGDAWWQRNWPPLHFNCRSCVRPIYREEVERGEVKVTRKDKLKKLPAPLEGFGHDPLEAGSFWRMTQKMWERAKRYGIEKEIEKLAKRLGLKEFVLEQVAKLNQKIKQIGDKILEETKNHYEKGVALDRNGETILEKSGEKSKIDFTTEELERLEGAEVLIHNHPGASSLSGDDIAFAVCHRIRRMVVVSGKYEYEIIFKGKRADWKKILMEWRMLRDKYLAEILKKEPNLPENEIRIRVTHKAVEELAQKGYFDYYRIERK